MPTLTHEQLLADARRQWQAHYDEQIFRKLGMKAPEPVANQSELDYRRETCRTLKRECLPKNHEYYKVQWRGLEHDALDAMEPKLFAVAEQEFYTPANVPPGQLREFTKIDPKTGQKMHEFVGAWNGYVRKGKDGKEEILEQEHFLKHMFKAARRAILRTPDTHPQWFADANRRANTNRAEAGVTVIHNTGRLPSAL